MTSCVLFVRTVGNSAAQHAPTYLRGGEDGGVRGACGTECMASSFATNTLHGAFARHCLVPLATGEALIAETLSHPSSILSPLAVPANGRRWGCHRRIDVRYLRGDGPPKPVTRRPSAWLAYKILRERQRQSRPSAQMAAFQRRGNQRPTPKFPCFSHCFVIVALKDIIPP
jgi:hypothetical protein